MKRTLLSLAAAAVAAAAAAPAAQAGILVAAAGSCAPERLEQPFLPWLDPASYVLAPDGAFEGGADGWRLREGAATVATNEPFFVHGADDRRALRIPAAGWATSPVMCVGVEHPTLRFFARRTGAGGLGGSRLDVSVVFETRAGAVRRLQIGSVPGDHAWRPTAPMVIGVNLLALLPGERTPVAFRFDPAGPGTWLVDDVYVDPYARH